MCKNIIKQPQYIILALNCIISCLFTIQEQILSDTKDAITMDVICILCAVFFSFIYISGYLNWNKGDISPFFFWALIIKRMFIIGINESEFIYFIFGFLNGIYSNKQIIIDENNYYKKSKTIISILIITLLIIYNTITKQLDNFIIQIILFSFLSILIGINDNCNINQQQQQQQQQQQSCQLETYKTDLKNNHQTDLKKCQTTIVQQQQQNFIPKSLWDQYTQQTDDWVCKIEINKIQLNESLENCEKNYSLHKSLNDYKLNIIEFFQNLQVVSCQTNLQQSIHLHSELSDTTSLLTWIIRNYFSENSTGKLELLKYQKNNKSGNDILQGDELSMFSPFSDQKVMFPKDQIPEISYLSAIPNNDLQGSGSVQQGKITLVCHYNQNQSIDLSVQVFFIDEDVINEGRKQYIILILRNIDKEIKTKVQLEKYEQQSQIFFKYISRIAADIGKIIQKINETKKLFNQQQKEFEKIKQTNAISYSFCNDDPFLRSEKHIGDSKQSNHLIVPNQPMNTVQKITSSHSQNHENQEENTNKIAIFKYIQIFQEIQKSIDQVNSQTLMLEQNNFNFFELFSNNTEWKEERFNLISTLNVIKEFYKNNHNLNYQLIQIGIETINNDEMEIISDKRKIKQILFNLINNSIENFEVNQSRRSTEKIIKSQQEEFISKSDQKFLNNYITLKAKGTKEYILIEIIDNAGGISQDQLKNRPNECKFGLSACFKLLKQMAYDPKKPLDIINYVKKNSGIKGTVVQFLLPKTLTLNNNNYDISLNLDSIQIINRVEQF